ncbi:uncharacterized protein LOC125877262 [Solanum stenotomum]|uniref:uncharacterized protein LOC125877262 n=1 Tax=Solanum stenotomum TaxID=172797 RepID=UPI0020D1E7EE|nr:uncharacterized protein LOC125877262 [Solanum stenotomum]
MDLGSRGEIHSPFLCNKFNLVYIIPPGRVNTRFLLSMLAAYSFGASVNAFPNYLFEIKQRIVLRLLTGITIGSGNLLCRAITARKRSEIYRGCMKYCFVLPLYALVFIVLDKSRSALLVIKIHTVQILFMGYLMIYSQEILYDADFGDINSVNCMLTVFFHLPGIVIHAARLYLQGAGIEQHEHN